MTKRRITLVAVIFAFILQCYPVTVLAAVNNFITQSSAFKSVISFFGFDKEQFNNDMELLKQTEAYKKVSASKIGQLVNHEKENFSMLGGLGSAAINFGANYFNNGVADTNKNIRAIIDFPDLLKNIGIEFGKDILTAQNTVQLKKNSSINFGAIDNGFFSLLASPIKLKKDVQTGKYTVSKKMVPQAANMYVPIIPGNTLVPEAANMNVPILPGNLIAPEGLKPMRP